jgi:hypothetical protein
MRPAHKRRTFGWFESRFVSHFEAALLRAPNLILRTLPFAEAKSDSQLLFIPKQEERYIYVAEIDAVVLI